MIKQPKKFSESSLKDNQNKDKLSYCYVLPIHFRDLKDSEIKTFRDSMDRWNVDEIIITEKDYKKLLKKSKDLKLMEYLK